MDNVRRRVYEIIEVAREDDKASFWYDMLMLLTIVVSILPLAFKKRYWIFQYTDEVTTTLFIVDYLLRLWTADFKLNDRSAAAFFRYPFTPWAIIDLVSILPTLAYLHVKLRMFRVFRLFRTLRVLRIFKALRYSKSMTIIMTVIRNSKEALGAVCMLAVMANHTQFTNAKLDSFVEPFFLNMFTFAFAEILALKKVGFTKPIRIVFLILTALVFVTGIVGLSIPCRFTNDPHDVALRNAHITVSMASFISIFAVVLLITAAVWFFDRRLALFATLADLFTIICGWPVRQYSPGRHG